MSDGWVTFLTAIVMLVGLAGTIVPILPGLAVLWGAALVYGFLVGFGAVGITVMVLLTILLIISVVKGIVLPRKMAEETDVGRWSQIAALIGAVIGFFVVPVLGFIIGALIGLFVAEWLNHREVGPAWDGTVAVAKGFGLSAVVDVGLGIVMISLWAFWALAVL